MCNLPAIVFRSIQYLEAKKADQEEGIYRLSGSSAVIKNLKDRFNNGKSGHLGRIWDVTERTGLLPTRIQKETSTCLHPTSIGIHMRLLGS
jgi:RalA-binding protein 1